MKVPNADRAIVDIRKLTDYCLSYEHPRGRHKAQVFQSALALTATNATEIRDLLLKKVRSEDSAMGLTDEYGTRYIVDFAYARSGKQAMLRSTWIIKLTATCEDLVYEGLPEA
jgi:hypothetical protein